MSRVWSGHETTRAKGTTRTLQRNQSPILQHLMLDGSLVRAFARIPLGQFVAEPSEVFIACACIRDDVKGIVGMLGNHGIIDDPTVLVEKHGEGGGVGYECRE